MYIANIFSRDLYLWDSFPDHNDLVRGYILEKYFVDTNPKHKLSQLTRLRRPLRRRVRDAGRRRASSSATSPRPSSTTRATSCSPTSCRSASSCATTSARSQKVRAMAVRIQQADPDVQAAARRDPQPGLGRPHPAARRRTATKLPPGATRAQVDELIAEIGKLTVARRDARSPAQVARHRGRGAARRSCARCCRPRDADPVEAIVALGQLMALARAARRRPGGVARPTPAASSTSTSPPRRTLQRRGSALLDGGAALTAKQTLRLLGALTDATYGVGLLDRARARGRRAPRCASSLPAPTPTRADVRRPA